MARLFFGLGLAIVAVGLAVFSYQASEGMANSSTSAAKSRDMEPAIKDFVTASYPVPGGGTEEVDVFQPPAGKSLRRGIILIHGGGWVSGGRHEMAEIARVLAADGFTGFSVDYRLARHGQRWPAQLQDVQAAVRFVRSRAKEYGIDPEKMAAAGVSAGGHLSMLLGTTDAPVGGDSSKVQAVCGISGILDLNQPLTPSGETYGIVQKLLTDDGKPTVEQKRQASPVTFVTRSSAPTYFLQGNLDPLVPRAQSENAALVLRKAGVEAPVVVVSGMSHGLDPADPLQRKALEDMAMWMKSKLK